MAKGRAINIGLNEVDPAHYQGWDGRLMACEFDANDMHALAGEQGYEGITLLTRDATAAAVTDAIRGAAADLEAGDILFLTYSGHGGQVPDLHSEEDDDKDETWVLYDRQLVDDELYSLWNEFKPGVRIFALSDSCHSGSVTRGMYPGLIDATVRGGFVPTGADLRQKSMPTELRESTYEHNRDLYTEIQRALPRGDDVEVSAHVILISGCQDNQESLDGERNGLFTQKLLEVWKAGRFRTYRGLRRKILEEMPPSQSPNYYVTGSPSTAFERQRPLTV